MSGQKTESVDPEPKVDAITNVDALTVTMKTRKRITENYLVIWADAKIDPSNDDCKNTLKHLRSIVNEVNICTTIAECIQSLDENNDEIVFVISSGALGQTLVPEIHSRSKLDAIYIFCGNKQWHDVWAKDWTKIKGVYTSIEPICEALQLAIKQNNQDNISLSIIGTDDDISSKNLNQLEPAYMYSQIFKEILLDMEFEQKAIKDLVEYCKEEYNGNNKEMIMIIEFQSTYVASNAISWYTRQCFAYKMLNGALRTLNGDIIIRMGFFLCDVHRQIESLHKTQVSQYQGKTFQVYRGQGLSTADFEKLVKNKGGIISFNSFLSTSENRDVGLRFANEALKTVGMVGILFEMTIDSSISSSPFASVKEVSDFVGEDEILFSMHTIFRIGEVKKVAKDKPLYQVQLQLTSDNDKQLGQLTQRIRKEASGSTGWYRLGKLLYRVGQFNKAEELYIALLEQTFDESARATLYHQLGLMKRGQGLFKEAVLFYEESLKIKRQKFSEDHISLTAAYSNLGSVYYQMNDYPKALEYYEKDVKITEKNVPPNHPDLATSYNNMALVYGEMGDDLKALKYHEKSLEILLKVLPPNHPTMASCYNNIGLVYDSMGNYSKALEFCEKSFEIKKNSLPPNHPNLAITYNNMGSLYENLKDYPKASQCYVHAVEIAEIALTADHPNLQVYRKHLQNVQNKL